ncbi:hypothetical protein PMIN03_008279 [Paraphaeosphaeria minitans]
MKMMFCSPCLSIFSTQLNNRCRARSFHGPHHPHIGSLRSVAKSCRICKAIWLECVTGFGKEDWSDAGVSTKWRVVHDSTYCRSVDDAIQSGGKMKLIIEVERVMGNDEIRRDMSFDLLPYNEAEHYAPATEKPWTAEAGLPSIKTANYQIHLRSPWNLKSSSSNTAIQDDQVRENTEYDWLPSDLIHQNVPEPASSVDSGTRLLDWYQNCLNNHPKCQTISDATYQPTRLLDIGKSYFEPVRLVTFSTEDAQIFSPVYATLSHCWGTSQPLRLLSSNLSQFQEGIARESIPRVFTEAIEVCWHLRIQYLWIDSLCILQDSVEDWSRESQRMGLIYSRALINISATGSTGCNDRLFSSADEAPSAGLVSWKGSNAKYVVVENTIEWTKSFMNQPLLQRAWVMQERLLATRVVHFTRSQVVWECRTTAATETYPICVPDALWPFHDRRNRFWREEFIEDDGAWSDLVGDYSRCELTFGKDKLVALSGLVSALEAKGLARGRYWAGLWDADLPYCLTWRRAAIDPSKWSSARPDTPRAPSWSWASLDYPVWTDWGASGASEVSLVSRWDVEEEKGPNFSASLLLYCPLSLRLNGPLVRAEIQVKKPWVEAIGRGVERVQGISYSIGRIDGMIRLQDDAWNDVVFDDFDDANMSKDIWCAPIWECEEWIEEADQERRLIGLLLEEFDHGRFRRIGVFSIGHWTDRAALKRLREKEYVVM